LTERPYVGLERAGELAASLADLAGASPDVARARGAVLLRSVGLHSSAQVVERW
jgi:hypothetical protein